MQSSDADLEKARSGFFYPGWWVIYKDTMMKFDFEEEIELCHMEIWCANVNAYPKMVVVEDVEQFPWSLPHSGKEVTFTFSRPRSLRYLTLELRDLNSHCLGINRVRFYRKEKIVQCLQTLQKCLETLHPSKRLALLAQFSTLDLGRYPTAERPLVTS